MNLRTISGTYVVDGEELSYTVLMNEYEGTSWRAAWYILTLGKSGLTVVAFWDNAGLKWFNPLLFPRYSGLVEYIGERVWDNEVKAEHAFLQKIRKE